MPLGIYKHKPNQGFQKGHPFYKGGEKGWFKKGMKVPKGTERDDWKGDEASYGSIHDWVKRERGKAMKCENLNCVYPRKSAKGYLMLKPKRYDWANVDHKYRRVLKDYIQLCASCHTIYDILFNGGRNFKNGKYSKANANQFNFKEAKKT